MARELQGDLTGAVTQGVGDELADDQLGDVGVGEGADLAGNDLAHGRPIMRVTSRPTIRCSAGLTRT
jgi:hypothetical protein